tara:strand:- start:279 stop:887 length:609 start_codon:yes stop_codon:yes gene_type:complete
VILLINSEVANIGSWENVLKEKRVEYILSNNPDLDLDKITKIIFPGIGNFSKVMINLERLNLKKKLLFLLKNNVPYLGVCVGMQILFNKSDEDDEISGLGIFDGKCLKIESKKIIKPHNGWNNIRFLKNSNLFNKLEKESDLYFNHSYYCSPKDKKIVTSCLEDDNDIITSIEDKNIYGVQFHPEKSQSAGGLIINNFINLK